MGDDGVGEVDPGHPGLVTGGPDGGRFSQEDASQIE